MTNITLRKATVEDIKGIMSVEKQSFTAPWTEEAFYHEIVNNQFANYLILEQGNQIIGYCGVWIIIDEAHITNLAILPDFRGKKLGEFLLREVITFSVAHGAVAMTLEVRVSNVPAQSLYRKMGFKDGGIRKGYYTDNYEDALVMWVRF